MTRRVAMSSPVVRDRSGYMRGQHRYGRSTPWEGPSSTSRSWPRTPRRSASFYADLFDWKIDADNPMNYGMVSPDDNAPGGAGTSGIGGGIGQMPEGMGDGYATFYVDVDDVETALAKAEKPRRQPAHGPRERDGRA